MACNSCPQPRHPVGSPLIADPCSAGVGGGGDPIEIADIPKQELVIECMLDDVNSDGTVLVQYVHATCIEIDSGVVTTDDLGDYTDRTLTTPYIVQGDKGPCPEPSGAEVSCCEMCDDVNGDGSTIVPYVTAYVMSVENGQIVSTFGGNYTDGTLTAPYAPVNGQPCSEVGDAVIGVSMRGVELTGSVWSRPSNVQSVSVVAVTIGGPGTSFVTTDSGVIDLIQGESMTWSVETQAGAELLVGALDITAGGGDLLHVTWTELET